MSEILEVGIKLSLSEGQTFTNEEIETFSLSYTVLFFKLDGRTAESYFLQLQTRSRGRLVVLN